MQQTRMPAAYLRRRAKRQRAGAGADHDAGRKEEPGGRFTRKHAATRRCYGPPAHAAVFTFSSPLPLQLSASVCISPGNGRGGAGAALLSTARRVRISPFCQQRRKTACGASAVCRSPPWCEELLMKTCYLLRPAGRPAVRATEAKYHGRGDAGMPARARGARSRGDIWYVLWISSHALGWRRAWEEACLRGYCSAVFTHYRPASHSAAGGGRQAAWAVRGDAGVAAPRSTLTLIVFAARFDRRLYLLARGIPRAS